MRSCEPVARFVVVLPYSVTRVTAAVLFHMPPPRWMVDELMAAADVPMLCHWRAFSQLVEAYPHRVISVIPNALASAPAAGWVASCRKLPDASTPVTVAALTENRCPQ